MVQLQSADGTVFFIDRNCAKISGVLKTCYNGTFSPDTNKVVELVPAAAEGPANPIVRFTFLNASQVERMLRYLCLKYKYDLDPDHRPPTEFCSKEEMLDMLALSTLLQC